MTAVPSSSNDNDRKMVTMTITHVTPASLARKLMVLDARPPYVTESPGYAPHTPFADKFREAFGDLGTGPGNSWLPRAAEVGLSDEWLRPDKGFKSIDPVDPTEALDLDELPWGFHLV